MHNITSFVDNIVHLTDNVSVISDYFHANAVANCYLLYLLYSVCSYFLFVNFRFVLEVC